MIVWFWKTNLILKEGRSPTEKSNPEVIVLFPDFFSHFDYWGYFYVIFILRFTALANSSESYYLVSLLTGFRYILQAS